MMLGAFLDLTFWSVRNRLRVRLRRLREPRYIVGALVGVLWLGSLFFRSFFRGARAGRHVPTPLEDLTTHAGVVRFGLTIALLALALLVGLWPGARRPLEFSPAEVQFLFPAPFTRRQLINYKLLRSQGGMLFGALIATLLLRPGTLRDGWMFSVGFWLGLTVSRLYAIGIGLSGGLRRRWPLVAAAIGAVGVLGIAVAPDWGRIAAMTGAVERLEELQRIWSSGAPRIVLWPFLTLASLPLAGSATAFWAAFPGVLLLVAVTYAGVMRADAAFEEASAAQAEKRAAAPVRVPTMSRRGKPAPFPLALEGRPETAILWKNLILLGRYASLKTLLRILPLLVLFPLMVSRGKGPGGALVFLSLSMTLAVTLLLVGPGTMRNDLRQDLGRLAVLKSWPVSGAAIVRGELLAPTIVLSVGMWLLILVAALAIGIAPSRGHLRAVLLAHRSSYTAVAMLVAPAFILAQLVVQNGIAVLFPAWMTTGRGRARGIEATGQQMLVVWGGFFAAIVLLVPPALGAGVVALGLAALVHARVLVAPAAVLVALLLAEAWLVTRWLGRVLDRTDLAAVDPVE